MGSEVRDGSSGAAQRPPPGLRGRDIGLWYARVPSGVTMIQGVVTSRVRYAAQSRKRQQLDGDAAPLLSIPQPRVAAAQQALKEFDACAVSRAPVHARASEGAVRMAAAIAGDGSGGVQFHESEEAQLQAQAAAHARSHAAGLADMCRARSSLPVHAHRAAILSAVQQHQVTLVCGETGCGKTTQVPQFILEEAAALRCLSSVRIICTQPRRISATSVAARVASERCEGLGQSVGFSIRLQQQLPRRRGSVTFCTTGVVLRMLQDSDALSDVSHLVIDEVHERDVNTDFLLATVKQMLPHRPHMKLLLMSATIDADRFARYFGQHTPIMQVPGLTHPVTDLFLEDVVKRCGYGGGGREGGGRPPFADWRGGGDGGGGDSSDDAAWTSWLHALAQSHGTDVAAVVARASCAAARDIDMHLVQAVIECICDTGAPGAVLVFLPGWTDITALHDMLRASACTRRHPSLLIPLHSMLPMTDQASVFARPPQGVRKIVIATCIAGVPLLPLQRPHRNSLHLSSLETSITIDDVVHVVDVGRCKSRSYCMRMCVHRCLHPLTHLPPLAAASLQATYHSTLCPYSGSHRQATPP